MPKIIELTVEIDVQRVSCPGVWLCQDGRVSLTVFALGTSYQTCLLPPNFPLMFKDVFYFRKRFQETCALNNICCLLKDETIYCELVQWCDDCISTECVILAQYLGALNDVLFPPNMCSSDGVDLLMRRSKDFPGILSPKIEIATKVRIDEVWNQPLDNTSSSLKLEDPLCNCPTKDDAKRHSKVCHSAGYHRNRCVKHGKGPSMTKLRSRSGSSDSRSCCSLTPKNIDYHSNCLSPSPPPKSCASRTARFSPPRRMRCRQYCVYNVNTEADAIKADIYAGHFNNEKIEDDTWRSTGSAEKSPYLSRYDDEVQHKTILESRYIEHNKCAHTSGKGEERKICFRPKVTPCICEICKRYHELFHLKSKNG